MTNSLGVGIPALDGLLRFDNFCAKEMRQPSLSHFGRSLLFAGERRDVADPWYTRDFDATYRDVLRGCRALLDKIRSMR